MLKIWENRREKKYANKKDLGKGKKSLYAHFFSHVHVPREHCPLTTSAHLKNIIVILTS